MPKKLLLTQSQVHVVLLTIIVCGLSAVVFLVGVIVQQRAVHSIHEIIKPKAPPVRHTIDESSSKGWSNIGKAAREGIFGGATKKTALQWSDFAYAQLVHNEEEACNALITFSQLHRRRSPVSKLLLFPQDWTANHEASNVDTEVVRQLIKKASRRYKTILVPISRRSPNDTLSISNLYALDNYQQVMTFPLPGLVVNSDHLDALFLADTTTRSNKHTSSVAENSGTIAPPFMVQPSRSIFDSLMAKNPLAVTGTPDQMKDLRTAASRSIFTVSEDLRTSTERFNATAFNLDTGYIQLSDSGFAGPEYDVPYEEIVKARPKDIDQGFTWEKMESTYKDLRFRVCGMDLLEWPPTSVREPGKDSMSRTELR